MRTIFCILLFSGFISVRAQHDDTTSLFSLGLKVHRSFIIQHTKKLSEQVTSSHPWMIETDVSWHLRKQDTWDYCNCFPRAGISLMYTNFDLSDILGEAISAYVFIEPFIKARERLNYSIRFGIGPSYLTTLYDEENNPDNQFFSSRISFLVLLNASVNYRMTPKLALRASVSYNHISNGGYSEPNLGMNFPSVSLGIDRSFSEVKFPDHEPLSTRVTNRNRYYLVFGLSAKPVSAGLNEKKYPVYVFGVNYSRSLGKLFAVNGGLEWVNDRSVYRSLLATGEELANHNRLGLLAGIDWLFGRFIFYQHFGVYVYAPVKALHPVYQRYGLSFLITKNIFAGLNIKAHGQDADFMDFRVGWIF